MKLLEMILGLAIFLAIASVIVPVVFSLLGMLLPFIGAVIVIIFIVALVGK